MTVTELVELTYERATISKNEDQDIAELDKWRLHTDIVKKLVANTDVRAVVSGEENLDPSQVMRMEVVPYSKFRLEYKRDDNTRAEVRTKAEVTVVGGYSNHWHGYSETFYGGKVTVVCGKDLSETVQAALREFEKKK